LASALSSICNRRSEQFGDEVVKRLRASAALLAVPECRQHQLVLALVAADQVANIVARIRELPGLDLRLDVALHRVGQGDVHRRHFRKSEQDGKVCRLARYSNGETIQRLRHPDLACQPARPGRAGDEIEQVLLLGTRGREAGEIRVGDHHVTGRTGHIAAAGALERLARALRDVEQTLARAGFDLDDGPVRRGEADLHAATRCASAAAAIVSSAAINSASVV
jgi:hypothetical protein